MKANRDRETGTKYIGQGHLPRPEKQRGRGPDPLSTIWAAAERMLGEALPSRSTVGGVFPAGA